ncbi:hypothetical protein IV203_022229 [Nitzschia inconspicua]|uniref:Uncharacterized protein n=1 Tax=Nitzschia inconspicua TaxID=303405 RepID=A0A9K3KJ51_9STRA|nr:hypothetical protein IV203_022229 [Nitzschia inconspicua]
MKILFLLTILPAATAAPFMTDPTFAIPRGGRTINVESSEISLDDYQRAEKAIFQAVSRLEEKVQHAIEDEVDILFHELEPHEKESIKQQAKDRVQSSAKKIRQKVSDHDHASKRTLPTLHDPHPFPFAWPKEDPEHRILHAVEAAEKAVLHAVEEEVKILFPPETKHEDGTHAKNVKKALKKSVEKVDKHVDKRNEHRRQKVLGDKTEEDKAMRMKFEDYLEFEMESME